MMTILSPLHRYWGTRPSLRARAREHLIFSRLAKSQTCFAKRTRVFQFGVLYLLQFPLKHETEVAGNRKTVGPFWEHGCLDRFYGIGCTLWNLPVGSVC